MNKIILFTAIAAVTCMFAGCEQNGGSPDVDEPQVDEPQVPHAGFSVAPNKYVKFAPGNLQYTQSTDTWVFAAEQYEMLGTDNVVGCDVVLKDLEGYCKEGAGLADKIDLFGWSGSTATAKWGIGTSTDYNDYSGDFVDWGQNIGDGKMWRILTFDEWEYLLYVRPNASTLYGVARIQISQSEWVNGLILLPDNWQAPAGVMFKSGFEDESNVWAYVDHQIFTLEEWSKLEVAGAVFLPASGFRIGSNVYGVQEGGYYNCLGFYNSFGCYGLCSGGIAVGGLVVSFGIYYGCAVRLVQDVN